MSLSQSIVPHLPLFRRFTRALSGSQEVGDMLVMALLEQVVECPSMFAMDVEPKIALYRLFLRKWNSKDLDANFDGGADPDALRRLVSRARQAYLLHAIEGFKPEEVAVILDSDRADIAALVAKVDQEPAEEVESATVLIIEDEIFEAAYLEEIVTSCGHRVVGIARTHREAVMLAESRRPQLLLTSVLLLDGSSGIGVVEEILRFLKVPVILISGFIEGQLTGKKPELTFAIAKPYNSETVKAIVGQALLFERGR